MKNSADQGEPSASVDNTLHSKYFLLLKGVSPLRSYFFRSPNITKPCPQVFSVNGSIICGGLQFWRHFDVNGSIILDTLDFWRHWFNMAKILSKFGEQHLVIVNYACGFNQSETGKYFEWIIMAHIPWWLIKPMKTLQLHYPIVQFLIIIDITPDIQLNIIFINIKLKLMQGSNQFLTWYQWTSGKTFHLL